VARLFAWFLIAEDRQRRLTSQRIDTLAHQASVVQHVFSQPSLRRVLLADEVGLGKTVEAGLMVRNVLSQSPGARILYLAPARLVRNVRSEFDRLGLQFRSWVASQERDASLTDPRVIASIHRAAHENRAQEVLTAPAWDMIIVDECHHLSDWQEGGGKPVAQYRLVDNLVSRVGETGRVVLMSGTPHQGHPARFANLLKLLQRAGERDEDLAGRVIYRTKDDVADWDGQPLFPKRQVNAPQVVDLGAAYQAWLGDILAFFEPGRGKSMDSAAKRRAAGWRAGQALQWATSSVQAGLGYMIRQAVRAGESPESLPALKAALASIRPYRMGSPDENIDDLWTRICREVTRQLDDEDIDDIEEAEEVRGWRPNPKTLGALLETGIGLLKTVGDRKWDVVWTQFLAPAGTEKVVLFAQPIETVTAVAAFLQRKTGRAPAMIIGNQSEVEREDEVKRFWAADGPQFLVSSRAGGEGINLQIARRLVHLDTPWNPMELEQRIGRVHRFKSRRTILVDSVVAKDSREVDTYDFARQKLHTIAAALVPKDRLDATFERVMALVPPEELLGVLTKRPSGPLDDEDQRRMSELVTRGFEQWRAFHETYSSQRKQIVALDPGAASWRDLALFARLHLGATDAPGYSALQFVWNQGEVTEASRSAEVLSIAGKDYACDDYGAMPVSRDDGSQAERLGTNLSLVARAIRDLAFPSNEVGAAYLGWPEKGLARPDGMSNNFGVLAAARHTVRIEQGSHVEHAFSLFVSLVSEDGQTEELGPDESGRLLQTLIRSTVRREPQANAALSSAMVAHETRFCEQLRTPTEDDRANGIRHTVTPLLAAIVD
jgi:superfamily II DNA or RNA helicase